jgi:hypothetical protein
VKKPLISSILFTIACLTLIPGVPLEAKNLQPANSSDNFNLYQIKKLYSAYIKVSNDSIFIKGLSSMGMSDSFPGEGQQGGKYYFNSEDIKFNDNSKISEDLMHIKIKIIKW